MSAQAGLDALAGALNKSAERVQTLWFSFLAVTLYFFLSASTTSHRMLLLEQGQTLPLLNVSLPLLPFYIIAPTFYVVLHAYVLMMLVLLSRTAKTFEAALSAPDLDGMTNQARERYRMRMENTLFLQLLVGGERERVGANGRILRAIALFSLAVAPVMVLLLFQLSFLPYHSEAITWWHRLLVLVDLIMVWTLWPSYLREGGERLLPTIKPMSSFAVRTVASVFVLAFSILVATYPSEHIHHNALATAMPGVTSALFGVDEKVEGGTVRNGLFANRLWLPHERFADDDKLRKAEADARRGDGPPAYLLDLSGRNLANANFTNADLRRVKFSGNATNLQFANFSNAWLQGSSFESVQLQGAWFSRAAMEGVSLQLAHLQGANLIEAQLTGAILDFAFLEGADLGTANLTGASLTGARLQATYLHSTILLGANLINAELQGADLSAALVDAAIFSNSLVWRALGTPSGLKFAELDGLNWERTPFEGQFATWLDRVTESIPRFAVLVCRRPDCDTKSASIRDAVREKLGRLDPRFDWSIHSSSSLATSVEEVLPYQKSHKETVADGRAQVIEKLACEESGSAAVLIRIIEGPIFRSLSGKQRKALGKLFLDARQAKEAEPVVCSGARWMPNSSYKTLMSLLRETR